ncbi:hypothetical protein Tco_0750267 [Tanacetum coccineum]|uniref:Uncharacterized protein n=1 Tax=Tanacetum coccineum TaxID=301880 RepID=A0ABQ4Z268_9ASTR
MGCPMMGGESDVGDGGGTLGGGDNGKFRYPLMEGDDKRVGDFGGKGYRGIGLWGKVRGELGEYLGGGFGRETVGNGDPRLQSKKSAIDSSFTLGSPEEADYVKILQSCNGLLLCCGSGSPVFYYVYNPSTNLYKKLPYPDCSLDNSPYYSSAGLRITFDPTKSPYYKLVDVGRTFCDIDIQIYSSETGKWSLCKDHFTTLVLIILIVQYIGMMGYRVHTDDFMTPLPEGWSIRPNVGIIVLGEKEQDSFLVIKLFEKVVQYNLISKTLYEIYDCGSNQLDDNHDDNDDDDDDDDELLQQFQPEHNVYEFIPSFASVDSVLGVVGARCFDLDLGVLVKSELQVSSELDLKVSSELSSEVTQKDYDQSFHQK